MEGGLSSGAVVWGCVMEGVEGVRGRFGRKEPYLSVRSLEGRLTEYFAIAGRDLDFTKHAVRCAPQAIPSG